MAYIFDNVQFRYVYLYCVLITFPMAQITPPLHAIQSESFTEILITNQTK